MQTNLSKQRGATQRPQSDRTIEAARTGSTVKAGMKAPLQVQLNAIRAIQTVVVGVETAMR
jgi:hypothetical protein